MASDLLGSHLTQLPAQRQAFSTGNVAAPCGMLPTAQCAAPLVLWLNVNVDVVGRKRSSMVNQVRALRQLVPSFSSPTNFEQSDVRLTRAPGWTHKHSGAAGAISLEVVLGPMPHLRPIYRDHLHLGCPSMLLLSCKIFNRCVNQITRDLICAYLLDCMMCKTLAGLVLFKAGGN